MIKDEFYDAAIALCEVRTPIREQLLAHLLRGTEVPVELEAQVTEQFVAGAIGVPLELRALQDVIFDHNKKAGGSTDE